MTRTTITIPEELLKRLKKIAHERDVSMAVIVREALEEMAAKHRPFPKSIGMGDSGYTDTARLAGDMKFPPRSWR